MVIQSLSATEDKNVFESFLTNFKSSESTHLKINIKKGWIGAARINCIGKSVYPYEQETLIPPYSVFFCKEGWRRVYRARPFSRQQSIGLLNTVYVLTLESKY